MDNAVETHDLAHHLKACDLLTAIRGVDLGLEKTGSNGIDRGERITGLVEGGASFDASAPSDQAIEFAQFLVVEAHGQTELPKVAT